jgi:hypothetical protein
MDFPLFEFNLNSQPKGSGPNVTPEKVENTSKKRRFADVNDENLNTLVNEAQAKKTKESTKWAVSVFKG